MQYINQKNSIDFTKKGLTLPRETEFYLNQENTNRNLISTNYKITVVRSLKNVVEKSALFREEDKQRFIFK